MADDRSADDEARIRSEFDAAVNMTPAALEKWLASGDSKTVGWKGEGSDGDGERVGHASGRHILRIKARKVVDLTDADYAHMQKVVGYVARHLNQRPAPKNRAGVIH